MLFFVLVFPEQKYQFQVTMPNRCEKQSCPRVTTLVFYTPLQQLVSQEPESEESLMRLIGSMFVPEVHSLSPPGEVIHNWGWIRIQKKVLFAAIPLSEHFCYVTD